MSLDDTDTTPHVWGYIRVSTRDQAESLGVQRQTVLNFAASKGIGEVDAIFTDEGVSGTTPLAKRPQGQRLMGVVKRGDHVIISKMDRGFRNTADFLDVMDIFSKNGVHLYVCEFLGGNLDFETPLGQMVATVCAAFSQLERHRIVERVQEALAAKKARGEATNGNPRYGFMIEHRPAHDGSNRVIKLVVANPKERALGRLILDHYKNGLSLRKIARLLEHEGYRTRRGTKYGMKEVYYMKEWAKKFFGEDDERITRTRPKPHPGDDDGGDENPEHPESGV